jgi:hypothetical protein
MDEKKNEAEPAAEAQQPAPAKRKKPGPKKVTKQEMVRRSLKKLGNDAKPKDIQDDIRKRYHTEMTPDHIKTVKGKILKAARAEQEQNPVPAQQAAAPAEQPAAQVEAGNGTGGIALDDILEIKRLLHQVGAEQLRTLIDAFAR